MKNNKLMYFGFFHKGIFDERSTLTQLALFSSFEGQGYFLSRNYSKISKEKFENESKDNPEIYVAYFPREMKLIKSALNELCKELCELKV